jgi:hypothetical protein
MAERREPGYSYAWFVSVALQRIHGITPAELRARRDATSKKAREQIRVVPSTPRANTDDGDNLARELENSIAALAAGKRLS